MVRRHLLSGVIAGGLTGVATAGVLFLLSGLQLTSFVPLDIANTIIALTPGDIATTTIETVGAWGKRLVVMTGVAGFVVAFSGLGVVLVWLMHPRTAEAHPRRWLMLGALLGVLPLALSLLIQYAVPANRATVPASISPFVLTLVYTLAGMTLGWFASVLTAPSSTTPVPASNQRRAFLLGGGGALLSLAAGSTVLAWLLPRSGPKQAGAILPTPRASSPTPTSTSTALPSMVVDAPTATSVPATSATALPTTMLPPTPTALPAFVAAPGTREEITKQEFLYVISSSTRDPIVDQQQWRLTVGGAVKSPFSLTYDELLALPRHDQTSTMECISNEVGNYLIGNCNWNGVLLRDLLIRAGVEDGVSDIVFRAADGYSESLPVTDALDAQTLIAYGIDGAALELKHGFPARIRIAGKYGVKNVKWLTSIEAVNNDYKGYWQQRGWTDEATIFTTSVFDTANPYTSDGKLMSDNGRVALGGIAFAGKRGIRKVEVQIDGADWAEARLKEASSDITWRLWRYDWSATPGKHTLVVRATDGNGEVQTAKVQDTHPDGATGHHTIAVEVMPA
ncbi:MAG: molybdopterin-dependent oxidoreductase [Chloroflexota bacterium]|nr:molybdopterin-dependent oxidoreductase [Chloroflexota bacterium]